MSIEPGHYSISKIIDQTALFFIVLAGFSIPISITATNTCFFMAAFLGIVSGRFFQNWQVVKHNPIVWSAVLFFLYTVIGLSWSIGPWGDRLAGIHKYAKLLYIPLFLPLFIDKIWRERAIFAFLLAVLITVIISYLKFFLGWHIGKYQPASFVFFTHIETGFLIAFAAYILAYYGWRLRGWKKIICWVGVVFFSFQEFFINNGRTGWVAYIGLLLLFAIQHFHLKGLILGAILMLLLLFSFYTISPTFHQTFNQSLQNIRQYEAGNVQSSLGYRLSFVDISWQLVKQKPVFGYGTGGFQTAYTLTPGVPNWRHLRTPHNEYLMTMVQLGIVGLLLLLLMFYIQLHSSFYLEDTRFLAQALLLAFLLSCAYNAFLYLSVSGHFYVFFTALCYAELYKIFERSFCNRQIS